MFKNKVLNNHYARNANLNTNAFKYNEFRIVKTVTLRPKPGPTKKALKFLKEILRENV